MSDVRSTLQNLLAQLDAQQPSAPTSPTSPAESLSAPSAQPAAAPVVDINALATAIAGAMRASTPTVSGPPRSDYGPAAAPFHAPGWQRALRDNPVSLSRADYREMQLALGDARARELWHRSVMESAESIRIDPRKVR